MKTRIEYSTMCLSVDNYINKISKASKFVESQGYEFGIQLHNSIDRKLYDCLIPLKNDYSFSVHSPLFAQYFMNLASTDYSFTKECIDKCTPYLSEAGFDILFFHGFFMTENRIIQDMKNYRRAIRQGVGDKYCLNGSFIMDPEFFSTDTFLKYKEIFKVNFSKLKEEYKNGPLCLALENDFVGIGSGLQRPQEINELIDNLWFDLGHFWTASVLHNFNYHEESFRLIDNKNIVGVHLNHNLIKRGSAPEEIRDSHEHFCMPSEMDLGPIVRRLFEKNTPIITLEIVDGDIDDIKQLFRWLE